VPLLLSKVITENDFADSIKNGFATTGLYPLNENAVNYNKCVKIANSNDTLAEDNITSSKILTHREYLESKIDIEVLQRFKLTKEAKITWETEDKYASLYDMWYKFVDDEINSKTDVSVTQLSVVTSPPSSSNDNLIEFPFPEYEASTSNDCE